MSRQGLSRATLVLLPMTLLTAIPLSVVFSAFLQPQPAIWGHLAQYVLPGVLWNTLLLLVGVGSGVLVLGTALAWLTAACEFPGRRFFSWALVLPLAMPAYVLAFVLVGWLDYTGPVQSLLRAWWGGNVWFPPIRSRGGALLVLSLAFYPYVYLLARQAFLSQGRRALEAAQTLGLNRQQAFWRVALPLARPWLAGGLILAWMESLADFGAVAIFNFDTFTTAIYKSWYALFNLPAAQQLAGLLVLLVLALIWGEARSRRGQHFQGKGGQGARIVLHGWQRGFAVMVCSLVLALAFALPLLQLLIWSLRVWAEDLDARYLGFLLHSLGLSMLVAAAVAVLALLMVYALRRAATPLHHTMVRLSLLGYAVPGTVLAVGIFVPVAWLDGRLIAAGWIAQPVLQGTLCVMALALCARFIAVGHQPVEAAMQRITTQQEDAACSLGCSRRALLWRLHLPMLRGGLLTALLLVFVETMKEMPITLMTRPFGWETLAVRIFEMTSEGMWERAALPALGIVLAGVLPVMLLVRQTEK